jgi:hypothetical protein
MKRATLLIVLGVFSFNCGGPGSTEEAVKCSGSFRASDSETGWSCSEAQQGGLWSCTCTGPGQVDPSVSDAICAAAKECTTPPSI